MLSNKKFGKHHIAFSIIGLALFFFYAGFMNDHMNVLSVVLGEMGWTSSQIYLGTNIGGYLSVILYLLCGIGMVKIGVKKIMLPSAIILGLAAMFLGSAGMSGNFTLYTVLLCIVRSATVPLQMGCFMMCANWYIKYRGRMMGWITIGAPLFSVVGVNLLSTLCMQGPDKGYMIFGGILAVIGVVSIFVLKDSPEDMGLYPDGLDHPPISEGKGETEIDISLGEILRDVQAWKLIISFGILQAIITGMMGTMALRYVMAGNGFGAGTAPMLYLSIGAGLGIIMSYLLGWLDDKLGSIKASIILGFTFLVCVIPFIIMPWDMTTGASPALMLTWAFGVACMTGGTATLHPAITSYVYGRRRYQGANKWIMTIQGILQACVLPIMNMLYDKSMPNEMHGPQPQYAQAGYIGFAVAVVIALAVLFSMIKLKDANLEDREYGSK